MRQIFKRLFITAELFSLCVLLVTVVLWLRSYSTADTLYYEQIFGNGPGIYIDGGPRGSTPDILGDLRRAKSRPKVWIRDINGRSLISSRGRFVALQTGTYSGWGPLQDSILGHVLQWHYGHYEPYDYPDGHHRWGLTDVHIISMPIRYPATILALPLAVRLFVLIRRGFNRLVRRNRCRNGLCPHCGYDLRATRDCCPECGNENTTGAIDAGLPRT